WHPGGRRQRAGRGRGLEHRHRSTRTHRKSQKGYRALLDGLRAGGLRPEQGSARLVLGLEEMADCQRTAITSDRFGSGLGKNGGARGTCAQASPGQQEMPVRSQIRGTAAFSESLGKDSERLPRSLAGSEIVAQDDSARG